MTDSPQFDPDEHFRTMGKPQPAALAALRVPFKPEQIGKLPKRSKKDDGTWGPTVYLDYVGHADVTDRLLSVDPTWTWEPFALTAEGLPALDKAGNLWIRLTVCGVTRIGVGDGKSAKECIGDALRNAAMRFGVALDLWAKGDREFGIDHDTRPDPVRAVQEHSPAPKPSQNVARIHTAMQPLDEAARQEVRVFATTEWGADWTPAKATDEQTDALVALAKGYQGDQSPT